MSGRREHMNGKIKRKTERMMIALFCGNLLYHIIIGVLLFETQFTVKA